MAAGYTPTPGVDARPMMDASTAPVDTTAAPMDFLKLGDEACPPGTTLATDPQPHSNHVWCQHPDGTHEGPEAISWDDGSIQAIRMNHDNERQGRYTRYYRGGQRELEATFRGGNYHGTATTWWPDGKVALVEHYVDGRADGEQRAYARDGRLLDRWSLTMGTGTMKHWRYGTLKSESAHVDGRPSGSYTTYQAGGKVRVRGYYVEGLRDGPWVVYDEDGQVVERGRYARDKRVGDWIEYDEHGATTRRTRWGVDGVPVFVMPYQGGAPLVPVPPPSPCDTVAGLARAAHMTPGDMKRLEHFPGLAIALDPDDDRNPRHWMADCAPAKAPSAAAVLARAGWRKATGKRREELAEAYVVEVLFAFTTDGFIDDKPDPREVGVAADGTATVTMWIVPPSEQRGSVRRRIRWTITPAGKVSRQTIARAPQP